MVKTQCTTVRKEHWRNGIQERNTRKEYGMIGKRHFIFHTPSIFSWQQRTPPRVLSPSLSDTLASWVLTTRMSLSSEPDPQVKSVFVTELGVHHSTHSHENSCFLQRFFFQKTTTTKVVLFSWRSGGREGGRRMLWREGSRKSEREWDKGRKGEGVRGREGGLSTFRSKISKMQNSAYFRKFYVHGNPGSVRRVDSSFLVFSLLSHRYSYISLFFSPRFIDS